MCFFVLPVSHTGHSQGPGLAERNRFLLGFLPSLSTQKLSSLWHFEHERKPWPVQQTYRKKIKTMQKEQLIHNLEFENISAPNRVLSYLHAVTHRWNVYFVYYIHLATSKKGCIGFYLGHQSKEDLIKMHASLFRFLFFKTLKIMHHFPSNSQFSDQQNSWSQKCYGNTINL